MSESEVDPFEAIATGLVEELNRLDLSATAWPPYKPKDCWLIRCGHCFITLFDDRLCLSTNSKRTMFQYEDPDMIEQLLVAIKRAYHILDNRSWDCE